MSTAQFAVLGDGRVDAPDRPGSDTGATRGMTLTAFMLLATYGALRWGTMLAQSPGGHLFGLLLLTLVIGWLGGRLSATRLAARVAATVGIVLAALAMIPMSGFPVSWLLALHFGRLGQAVGNGVGALPQVIVPYSGSQVAINGVILLGAGMLLLAGALALCSPRRQLGQGRLIAAAVPLIVLAIVPTVLSEPHLAGVHGVILFLLLMALLFSERVASRRVAGAAVFALLASVVALIVSPAIQTSHALFNVKTIGAGRVHFGQRFDWSQTYGRLTWPHDGADVLTVQARFPSYWKAEDLDLFNGSDWVSTDVAGGNETAGISRASLSRWTEPLTVTLGTMSTRQLIAAGVASQPQLSVIPGNGPGTWETQRPLGPNTTYHVDVYSPSPSRAELAGAPAAYPMSSLAPELQLILPTSSRTRIPVGAPIWGPDSPVQFAPFGSLRHLEPSGELSRPEEVRLLRTSAYAPAFRLAMRLRSHAQTPYGYLEAVLRYLAHGFTYAQVATPGRYPLVNFLLKTRTGYCQQFAGAMAMLLRMGGVPARVAAGFTTGVYDVRTHLYSVSDLDAHTWVEAWFAGYGWVTFDPTPPADPALSGHIALPAGQTSPAAGRPTGLTPALRSRLNGAAAPAGQRHQSQPSPGRSGGGPPALPIVGASLLLLMLLGLALLRYRRPRGAEGTLQELERAFARCGRPLSPAVTLAGLERRLADVPEAAEYVRTLRAARYAGGTGLPSTEQRRALRRRLRAGLGPLGWVRALIALPPLSGPSVARRPGRGGLH